MTTTAELIPHFTEKFKAKMSGSKPLEAAWWIEQQWELTDGEKWAVWNNIQSTLNQDGRDINEEQKYMPGWVE